MNISILEIMHEGTLLCLVPHEPDNGYRFYCSGDGTIGLRIAPNGQQTVLEGKPTTTENSKDPTDAKRKQRYLKFNHPWNTDETIQVSHAVYLAWVGPFDEPCIDHKNGITTDNRWQNLEPVSYAENARRTKVLNGLRKVGINPAELPFDVLDRYLDPKIHHAPHELSDREISRHCEGNP